MTIYILLECTGGYEDYYESIVSAYTSLSSAEKKKRELENIALSHEDKFHECCGCEHAFYSSYNPIKYDEALNTAFMLKCFKPHKYEEIDTDGDNKEFIFECKNQIYFYEKPHYKIQEVEVEE